MSYVDGFLLAVPKEKLDAYKEVARKAGEVWKEHGALACVECIADDVPYGEVTSFPRAVQAKDDEVVIFSWIKYESKAKRDEVNEKVMSDPRMDEMMKAGEPDDIMDPKRMFFGGFEVIVDA